MSGFLPSRSNLGEYDFHHLLFRAEYAIMSGKTSPPFFGRTVCGLSAELISMLANKKRSVFLALEAERFFLGETVASSLFVASAFFRAAAPGVPVAVFYFLIAVLTLVTLFKVEYIIRLWGRIAVLFTLTTIAAAASFALVFVPPSSFGALLLMGVLLMAASLPVLLDMISESFTFDKAAGRSYGLQWSSYYLGFIPATFLSTYLLQNYGFSGLFFILGLLYAAMLFPAVILSRLTGRLNHFGSRKITLRAFLGGGWFAGIYFVAVALQFFYAIMAVYMPLYLRENGYSWEEIGLMFTIMLLPFLLVEYWAGAAADRWWGERELLAVGAGLIVLSMFWIVSAPPQMTLVWAAVLFVSRVGAA
ncbi:MAG TPA: MFS transporter, partial [Candidatus Moranbacteria bacterium]|nr:MFS transporter [Candidatus Moranbacteria bacterium]